MTYSTKIETLATLFLKPKGKAMAQLKRTSPRKWLGNGMGHDPAEYAIVNQHGQEIGHIQFFAGRWNVIRLSTDCRIKHRFDTFKTARKFALENF